MTNMISIAVAVMATNQPTYRVDMVAVQTVETRTNVSESLFKPGRMWNLTGREAEPKATEKWVTTTVLKEDRLKFKWMGEWREVVNNTVISSNTVHLRVKQEWVEVKGKP